MFRLHVEMAGWLLGMLAFSSCWHVCSAFPDVLGSRLVSQSSRWLVSWVAPMLPGNFAFESLLETPGFSCHLSHSKQHNPVVTSLPTPFAEGPVVTRALLLPPCAHQDVERCIRPSRQYLAARIMPGHRAGKVLSHSASRRRQQLHLLFCQSLVADSAALLQGLCQGFEFFGGKRNCFHCLL